MRFIKVDEDLRELLCAFQGHQVNYNSILVDQSNGNIILSESNEIPTKSMISKSAFLDYFLKSLLKTPERELVMYNILYQLNLCKLFNHESKAGFVDKYDYDYVGFIDNNSLNHFQLHIFELIKLFMPDIQVGDVSNRRLVYYYHNGVTKLSSWNSYIQYVTKSGWNKVKITECRDLLEFIIFIYSNSDLSKGQYNVLSNLILINFHLGYDLSYKIAKSITELLTKYNNLPLNKTKQNGNCINRLQEQGNQVKVGDGPKGSAIYGRRIVTSIKIGHLSYKARVK